MIDKIIKFAILLSLLFFVSFNSSIAAEENTLFLNLGNLDDLSKSCTTGGYWLFHEGHNIDWAIPEIDDSEWEIRKTYITGKEFRESDKYKYGWYRLHLNVDSSLWQKELGISFGLIGAIEIYLNGKLVYTKGKVGATVEDEEVHFISEYASPINIKIEPKNSQVLAVRFSGINESLVQHPRIAIGFILNADLFENAQQRFSNELTNGTKHQMFFTGLSFAFGLLHLLMFFAYRQNRKNLYFAIFTLSCAILSYAPFQMSIVSNIDKFLEMLFLFKLSLIGCSVFAIKVLYAIFYEKPPKFFKYFVLAGLLFMVFHSYLSILHFFVIELLFFIEAFRIVVKAIYEKKKFAWMIGVGFSLFLFFSGYQMLIDLIGLAIWDHHLQPYLVGIMMLMISISLYLAHSISATNLNLEKRLVEVKELSEKTIEQEVSRKLLQKDIEHKEEQLEKAAKLEQTLSELEKAHDQLKEADIRMRSIIDASPVPLIVTRIDNGTILYSNRHLGNLVGYTVEELEGKSSPDFYYDPEERSEVVKRLERDGFLDNHEVRIKHRDGGIIWCIFSLVASKIGEDAVIIGGLYDISERKEAEEKLKLYRRIFDSSQDGIMVFDTDGKLILRNPAHRKLSGLQDKDVKDKSVLDLVPETARLAIRKGLESGTTFRGEFEWLLKDGTERPIDLSVFTIPDADGHVTYSVGMGRDISERRSAQLAIQKTLEQLKAANEEIKQTQTHLIQSEKMASLGQLVAGIAHEINNPVGAISSIHDTQVKAIDKLKDHLQKICALKEADQDILDKYLRIIDDANKVISNGSDRVAEIVRRLKSFARLDEAELQKVDINECIDDTLGLIHHEIKHNINVLKRCGRVPPIACYPGQLNQVLLNLLINAKHALEGCEEKGEIHISTSFIENRVLITIEDNGKGISKDNLDRIFDPGFTTKGVGIGTGLGLSICYQIIKEHRGEIKVESKEGFGTIFVIDLPSNLEDLLENNK